MGQEIGTILYLAGYKDCYKVPKQKEMAWDNIDRGEML